MKTKKVFRARLLDLLRYLIGISSFTWDPQLGNSIYLKSFQLINWMYCSIYLEFANSRPGIPSDNPLWRCQSLAVFGEGLGVPNEHQLKSLQHRSTGDSWSSDGELVFLRSAKK